jgi:hypothetical protein
MNESDPCDMDECKEDRKVDGFGVFARRTIRLLWGHDQSEDVLAGVMLFIEGGWLCFCWRSMHHWVIDRVIDNRRKL